MNELFLSWNISYIWLRVSKRKRGRDWRAWTKISLIFQNNYHIFCLSFNIIMSHFTPQRAILDKFRCISAVQIVMPWCKRNKRDDVTMYLNVGRGYIWALTEYGFGLLGNLYLVYARGSCRIKYITIWKHDPA